MRFFAITCLYLFSFILLKTGIKPSGRDGCHVGLHNDSSHVKPSAAHEMVLQEVDSEAGKRSESSPGWAGGGLAGRARSVLTEISAAIA